MLKKPAPLLVAAALFTASLAACDDKQKAAAPAMPAPEVTVIKIEPQRVTLSSELPGRTSAYRVAELRPQVGGIIVKRLFTEGAEVKAGQQLYQIDPATYQAALQSAQADLAKAQANLKSIQAKAARYGELVQINAVARQEYDDVVASLDQAKAQVMVAQASVATARINVDYTRVYAPITGRIGKSNVTEGALVTANQATALATITQLDPIYVDLSQSSSDLLRLRQAIATGQVQGAAPQQAAVTLTMDGATQPYGQKGQLQFSDITVDPTTGAVQVRAVFPNPNQDLYPGMFVKARLDQAEKEQAIVLPQRAVVRTPDGSALVWVVGADNKVQQRPIQIAQGVEGQWLVTNGLNAGESVVLEGLQKIKPNIEVRPVPPAAPAPAAAQPAKP